MSLPLEQFEDLRTLIGGPSICEWATVRVTWRLPRPILQMLMRILPTDVCGSPAQWQMILACGCPGTQVERACGRHFPQFDAGEIGCAACCCKMQVQIAYPIGMR